MVDYGYKDLFYKRNTEKKLKIATDDGLFTASNSDIKWENFELTESLCSESELHFGSCEASMVKFQILNAFIPLVGKWLTVTETIGGNNQTPFQYGKYKVFSDMPTADKEYRDIVAYDAMYDILNADVSEWYNTVLPNKNSTKTMKQFRESFIQHFELTEVVPEGGLVNDDMIVERTIEPEQISGKDVITAICEINGCFGHIGRDGKFYYIYLSQDIQGLYPATFLYPNHVPEQWDYLPQAETGSLYPQSPKSTKIGTNAYKKCQYEDYHVRQINKLQIRQEENDIGTIYPKTEPNEKDNSYIIEDNFLVYGKSTEELDTIAENIFRKISEVIYRPFDMDCVGNPCLEVGDPIRATTKYVIVESYILSRTLNGIQGKNDSYSAKGSEKRKEQVNSVQKSIIQLKGKSNVLERTIEETRIEITDIEAGLQNEISVTAKGLRANITEEKNRAEGEETRLSNSIKATAEELSSEITKKTQTWDTLGYTIDYTGNGAPQIPVEGGKYYLDEQNGDIYEGVAEIPEKSKTTWKDIAFYEYYPENSDYRISRDDSAEYGYSVPNVIDSADLKDYDWGSNRPDDGQGSIGDIYLEVTLQYSIDYWVYVEETVPGQDAHWEKVGKATLINFPDMASQVTQTAEEIKTTVKKGDVSSEISQESDKISITGNRISITSQNFQLTDDGKVNCTGATVSGTIKSTGDRGSTEVTNGGFFIYNNSNQVTGCFYGSTGGRLDIYKSPGNTENLAFSASASKTDIYAGGLRVHQGGLVVDNDLTVSGDASVDGNFSVNGTKKRIINTKDYGTVEQYCYEMTSPVFGDIGTGKTDENGVCYVYFDPVFAETVSTCVEYCVFLQKEGNGDIWVSEKTEGYFLVQGTPNIPFSWEVKAKQAGFEYERLENYDSIKEAEFENYESMLDNVETDGYVDMWNSYLESYNKSIEESEEMAL